MMMSRASHLVVSHGVIKKRLGIGALQWITHEYINRVINMYEMVLIVVGRYVAIELVVVRQ